MNKYRIIFKSEFELTKEQSEMILNNLKFVLYQDFDIVLKDLKIEFLWNNKNYD